MENKVAKWEIQVYIFSYARERKAKSGSDEEVSKQRTPAVMTIQSPTGLELKHCQQTIKPWLTAGAFLFQGCANAWPFAFMGF
ncbi:hypothetical protein JY493_26815 [Serratia marcescens]|nr:hypothetical protein [Serratia marcescens]